MDARIDVWKPGPRTQRISQNDLPKFFFPLIYPGSRDDQKILLEKPSNDSSKIIQVNARIMGAGERRKPEPRMSSCIFKTVTSTNPYAAERWMALTGEISS